MHFFMYATHITFELGDCTYRKPLVINFFDMISEAVLMVIRGVCGLGQCFTQQDHLGDLIKM